MGFFNRNKQKSNSPEAETPTSEAPNEWQQSLGNLQMTNPNQSAEQITDSEYHRRKIINQLENGKFTADPLDPATERKFYEKIGNSLSANNSYAEEEKFLSKIKGNLEDSQHGLNWVTGQIAADPAQQYCFEQTCAVMGIPTDPNTDRFSNNSNNLTALMNTKTDANFGLNTPVGFEAPRRAVLDNIRNYYPEGSSEYQQYIAAMDRLENNIYGKKFEYHQAMESIREEAPDKLGWNQLLDPDTGKSSADYYAVETSKRTAEVASTSHEQDPAYAESYQQGVALAEQLLALRAQNPAFADALEKGFRETMKSGADPKLPYSATDRWFNS